MKNTLILLLVIFLISTSCKDDNQYGDLVDTFISLSLISEEGKDLLNPENGDHLTESDIILYEEKEYKQVRYKGNPNLDYPDGFFIFGGEPYYRIRIFPMPGNIETIQTYYIQWGDIGMDTIKLEIVRKNDNAYEVTEKVWYNGEKVYDENIEYGRRHFIITKDIQNEENQ